MNYRGINIPRSPIGIPPLAGCEPPASLCTIFP